MGIDGLKHSSTNKKWTAAERFALVSKVLAGHSMSDVAREAHINAGQLYQWVRKYRESGMGGLECRAGRRPKAPDMPKKKKVKLAPSEREELELLRARNEYLEAENAYLNTRCLGDEEGCRASQGEKAKAIKGMMDSGQGFRLPTLLKAVSLPKSTYYFEIGKPDADAKNREAIELIQAIFKESKGRYGVRRVTRELNARLRERHKGKAAAVNHKKVQRIMGKFGLKAIAQRSNTIRTWGQ